MNFAFQVTPSDRAIVAEELSAHSATTSGRNGRLTPALCGCFLLVFAAIFFVLTYVENKANLNPWPFIHTAIAEAIAIPGAMLLASFMRAVRTKRFLSDSVLDFTLTEEGLATRRPGLEAFSPWTAFTSWRECNSAFLLWNTSGQVMLLAIVLPKQQMDPSIIDNLRHLLAAHVGPASGKL